MNLIQEYKPQGIAVTELSAQLWYEKQVEFSLERGRVKTQEMQTRTGHCPSPYIPCLPSSITTPKAPPYSIGYYSIIWREII